jgi:hypothetical protein
LRRFSRKTLDLVVIHQLSSSGQQVFKPDFWNECTNYKNQFVAKDLVWLSSSNYQTNQGQFFKFPSVMHLQLTPRLKSAMLQEQNQPCQKNVV